MKTQAFLFLASIALTFQSCSVSKTQTSNSVSVVSEPVSTPQNLKIAFYNVENLFDTVDDPKTPDEEFTPEGKNKWTPERYKLKLNHLAKVISAMDYPVTIGLSEIENETVVQDLAKEAAFSEHPYKVVHYESPDARGIDVAFLYQEKYFKVLGSRPIRINFPREKNKNMDGESMTTRDILQIDGILAGKDTVHYFVNHWPSRRGGQDESEVRRIFVASQLRKAVDEIFAKNANANIIIVGDLNDETDNKSLTEVLKAKTPSASPEARSLFDLMVPLDKAGEGTYNFKGAWNMLDHIIVSSSLLRSQSRVYVSDATIFKRDFFLYKESKTGNMLPSHTYVGPKYYGGYSDHLPVCATLNFK